LRSAKLANNPSPDNSQKNDSHRPSHSHGTEESESSDQIDIFSTINPVDPNELGSSSGAHSYQPDYRTTTSSSINLPPIIGDSKNISPQNWESLTASERVAFLQRWLMYAEVKYKCPVDCWPEAFAAEWVIMKDASAVQCLVAAEQKVAAGKSALNYVARVMEGDLPDDAEQWRVLYVQAYHITGTLSRACTRLQCKIDAALIETQ
jgi:hypothetical protein